MEIKKMEIAKSYIQQEVQAQSCQIADEGDLLEFQSSVSSDMATELESKEPENKQNQDNSNQGILGDLISYLESLLEKLISILNAGKTENSETAESTGNDGAIPDNPANNYNETHNNTNPNNSTSDIDNILANFNKTDKPSGQTAAEPHNPALEDPNFDLAGNKIPYIDEPDESVNMKDGKRTELYLDSPDGTRYYFDNYSDYSKAQLENEKGWAKRTCGTAEIKPEWGQQTEYYIDYNGSRYYFNSAEDKAKAQEHIKTFTYEKDGKTYTDISMKDQLGFDKLVVGKSPC